MSFLKEFKDDLAQAAKELVSEDETEVTTKKQSKPKKERESEEKVTLSSSEEEMESLDLDKINSVLDAVDEEIASGDFKISDDEENNNDDATVDFDAEDDQEAEVQIDDDEANDIPKASEDVENQENSALAQNISKLMEEEDIVMEEDKVKAEINETDNSQLEEKTEDINKEDVASDEVTDITKGTTITGSISSTGSVNVYGNITGDISCKGKLTVTGTVKGTSQAREIFANNAKIEGDVRSDGTVKVGNGTVIIGNVYATSAVIGGAIKGDIDVHGPVVVDSTAVVKGNIKSKSVQINNGAAIEGFCSQCYAEIDYKSLFDETFGD